MQWPIEDRLWKVGRVKKVKGIDHKAFARFIPKDWPSRDFFVSSIFFLSLVIFTAQEEKKKRFSCSLVTRQHMRARASVFVARWQAAVEPVGSISLLVEDSTVVVLCFAAKRKKNLTWHWASWSWKGMTSRWPSSKKRTQSSRTVSSLLLLRAGSLVFVSRLFVQVAPRHVGIVLPPVETYPIDAAATTTVFLFFGVSCSV